MSTSFIDSSADNEMYLVLKRQNSEDVLVLARDPVSDTPAIAICETENVTFMLRGCQCVRPPTLSIQDVEMSTPVGFAGGSEHHRIEYSWSSTTAIFLNHFGWSNLSLKVETEYGTEVYYCAIEVFATKINAERAGWVLHYLEAKMQDVTRSCFTGTSRLSDADGAGQTLLVLLQEIEKHLAQLRTLLPHFLHQKRSRLTPTSKIVQMESAPQIPESSIIWALSHADSLVLSQRPSPSSILFRHRYYDLSDIETEVLHDETNVYENQIIAGYLESIARRLSEINRYASELQQSPERASYVNIPVGFASISMIQKEYENKFCANVITRCQALQRICQEHTAFFQQHLPVRQVLQGMPKMTPGFLATMHYQKLFQQIVSWYRLGKLTMSGERYLYGLRTLDKLYEFFCLFRIIEALEQLGWKMIGATYNPQFQSPTLILDTRPADSYLFTRIGGDRLRLLYEPVIKNSGGMVPNLVVTEYDVSERRPDFLLEFNTEELSTTIIFDAKYSTRETVWNRYISELAMKYLLGLGSPNGGPSPVRALFLLYPSKYQDSFEQVEFFHRERANLYSPKPTFPALGTIEVSPDDPAAENLITNDSLLRKMLDKLLSTIK